MAVTPPAPVMALLRELDRPEVPRLRWTTPDQWHVTLRFLGEVDPPGPVAAGLAGVPAGLAAVGAPGVEAVLGPSLAWFPGRQVLQVPVAGLDALAGAVAEATAPWGPPPERPFAGHLTLARMRGRARGPARLAGTALSAAWPVDRVELVSSTMASGGSRYRTEASVVLA